jgi:hypothetical protein
MRQLVAKDIQAGVPSVSEHGFTLIGDDSSAAHFGDLVKHGAPYLNARAANEWVERIAPFTGMSPADMLKGVDSFGQHVVNINATDAWFGEMPLSSW